MKKSLAFWPLFATILCCVSGGPFGLEPVMHNGIGMGLLLIVLTPIVWSLPAALMTAELSSALPEEGGYYVWVRRALGPFGGFLCGWWSWIYSWIDVAIYPVLFVTYGQRLLALIGHPLVLDGHPWASWGIGMSMIMPLTLLNILGTEWVGESSIWFFGLILAPFGLLIAIGIPSWISYPPPATLLAPDQTASHAFSAGLFVVMWNYLGWDSLSTVAGEVKNPQRSYPRAIALAVPAVTLVYLLPVLAGVTFMRHPEGWNDGAWVDIAELAGGRELAIGVAVAGLISSAALFSSTLLAGSRVPFVIAEDRVLPPSWTKVHPRFGTPWVAILVSAVFYSVFSFASFGDLAKVDVLVYSAGLILEFAALAVLRVREPNLPRPYRIPGGWPVIVLVIALPLGLLAAAVRDQATTTVDWPVKLFVALALLSGPAVWGMSRLVRRRELERPSTGEQRHEGGSPKG